MNFSEKVRGCDQFGAPIHLKLSGNDSFKTLGGGVALFCLRALILTTSSCTYLMFWALRIQRLLDTRSKRVEMK